MIGTRLITFAVRSGERLLSQLSYSAAIRINLPMSMTFPLKTVSY